MTTKDLITKVVRYRGDDKTLYFRELTMAEQISLLNGSGGVQKAGQTEVTIDYGREIGRSTKLAFMTLTDQNGEQAFNNEKAFYSQPATWVSMINTAAAEAMVEFKERATGN